MKKPRKAVLDSYAVLAFLFQEEGSKAVLDLFEWAVENRERHLITAVNWAEVCYIVQRKAGRARWPEVSESLARLPLEVVATHRELAERAAYFKVKGAISLADCFAAALAQELGLPLYTGDPEFRVVQSEIEVRWI